MRHGSAIGVDVLRPVDPASAVALYRQIADQLAGAIEGATPGTRLPSEPEIVTRLGVSRATATQALRDLEHRGLVYRRQGKGTFVANTGPVIRTDRTPVLPSFSEDLRNAGRQTRERVVVLRIEPASDAVVTALGLRPRQDVWHVERIIVGDDEPAVHVISWLPCAVFDRLTEPAIEGSSLYEQLRRPDGSPGRPCSADEQWSAAVAPARTASLLELSAGMPAMRVLRTAYLHDGTPAEYSVSYVRGETFAVSIQLDAHQHLTQGVRQLWGVSP